MFFDVGFVRFMLGFCFRCGLLKFILIVACLLRLVNSVVHKLAFVRLVLGWFEADSRPGCLVVSCCLLVYDVCWCLLGLLVVRLVVFLLGCFGVSCGCLVLVCCWFLCNSVV